MINIEKVKDNNVHNTYIRMILKEESYRNCWALFWAFYWLLEIPQQVLVDKMLWWDLCVFLAYWSYAIVDHWSNPLIVINLVEFVVVPIDQHGWVVLWSLLVVVVVVVVEPEVEEKVSVVTKQQHQSPVLLWQEQHYQPVILYFCREHVSVEQPKIWTKILNQSFWKNSYDIPQMVPFLHLLQQLSMEQLKVV